MKNFLAGLGIGVGLGVLFAPNSGDATRRKLRERFTGLRDDFGRQDAVQETISAHLAESSGGDTETRLDFPPRKDQARELASTASSDPINTLSREELLNVSGIGPTLAERIIAGRPYSSRRELVGRGILPQSTFEELDRELSRREKRSA